MFLKPIMVEKTNAKDRNAKHQNTKHRNNSNIKK